MSEQAEARPVCVTRKTRKRARALLFLATAMLVSMWCGCSQSGNLDAQSILFNSDGSERDQPVTDLMAWVKQSGDPARAIEQMTEYIEDCGPRVTASEMVVVRTLFEVLGSREYEVPARTVRILVSAFFNINDPAPVGYLGNYDLRNAVGPEREVLWPIHPMFVFYVEGFRVNMPDWATNGWEIADVSVSYNGREIFHDRSPNTPIDSPPFELPVVGEPAELVQQVRYVLRAPNGVKVTGESTRRYRLSPR